MIMIIFGNLASEIGTAIVWCKADKFDMRARKSGENGYNAKNAGLEWTPFGFFF